MNYNSDYDIRLKMLESLGGDVTRKYDSVYSIDLEILRLMENGGGGGGGGTSIKTIIVEPEWYDDYDRYQTEMKKAFDEINNEFSNKRIVKVRTRGFYSQSQESILESTIVQFETNNSFSIYFLSYDKHILRFNLQYDEGSNYYVCRLGDDKFATKSDFYSSAVYTDGQIDIDTNDGRISEFISEPTVDNEEFVVIKTTVKAYTGTDSPNNEIYTAMRDDNGYNYLLSKFGGMRLWQRGDNANFDLLPDGDWYVIFGDIAAATYVRCIVTKAVRNVDGTLDVYLGFKGYDIDSLCFWDCTVDNRDSQGDEGKWNEKNWVKVSDAENISVDSFIGRRTRYFCVNTEGVKVDRLVLFKRMK